MQERPCGATGKAAILPVVLWHIADMPGVQGERRGVALPPLPGCVGQHPFSCAKRVS